MTSNNVCTEGSSTHCWVSYSHNILLALLTRHAFWKCTFLHFCFSFLKVHVPSCGNTGSVLSQLCCCGDSSDPSLASHSQEPAVLHFHLEHFEFDNWLIIKFLMSLAGFTFFYASPVHWAEVNLSAASRLTRLSRTWEPSWTTTASNESPLSSPRGATGRKVHHNSG